MNFKDRSRYFQTAARYLFERRGAPFILTPVEFAVLNRWASMGIPQRIVLEGIKNAFDNLHGRSVQRKKLFKLIQCEYEVIEAFNQYKDRKTGGDDSFSPPEESIEKLKREVIRFIDRIPSGFFELEEIFCKVRILLTQGNIDEEFLEMGDAKVERILLTKGTKEEKQNIRESIKIEYKEKGENEIGEIFRIKWIKHLRRKYKIPYLSLFYY